MVKQFLRLACHISTTLISKETSQNGVDNLLVMAQVYMFSLTILPAPSSSQGDAEQAKGKSAHTHVCGQLSIGTLSIGNS